MPRRARSRNTARKRRPSPERELTSVIVPGARPRPPYLFEEFSYGVPTRPDLPKVKRRQVTRSQLRYMLYALADNNRISEISARLNIPRRTVETNLQKVRDDPMWFYICDWIVVVRLGANKRDAWAYCRYCAELAKTPAYMTEHAYGHVWDDPRGLPANRQERWRHISAQESNARRSR